MELEDLRKLNTAELNILAKKHNIKKISSLVKEEKIKTIFDYLKMSDLRYLQTLKVKELNEIIKKHKIKNLSILKKDGKINGIIKFFNENKNTSTINDETQNDIQFENENISEDEYGLIELDPEPLIITLRDKPKILVVKNDNINHNNLTINYIKDILKLDPDIGDIIQIGTDNTKKIYGKSEDKIIPLTGFYSEYIYIPYEISKEFKDAYDFYYELFEEEEISEKFYGVEIKYDDEFIKKNFGILENKYENEKIFRLNHDMYGNCINVFLEKINDPIKLCVCNDWKNNFLKYSNSFNYIDDFKSIYSKDNSIINIEFNLKNEDEEFLSDKEEEFIYTDFPDNCLVNIDIDFGYVTVSFRYNKSNKKEIEEFIEDYYFSEKKEFIQNLEKS
tara:strand:+ start:847 stop:2019 length:1173 start_codon:yes stop_codon:yes gene_type:complete